jgi:GGDEF domain-containing protein
MQIERMTHTNTVDEPLRRSIELIAQALQTHTLKVDETAYRRFCEQAATALHDWAEQPPDDLMVRTGALIQAYSQYNVATDEFLSLKLDQLTTVISSLAKAASSVDPKLGHSVAGVERLASRARNATISEDLIAVRTQLTACLEALQQEIAGLQPVPTAPNAGKPASLEPNATLLGVHNQHRAVGSRPEAEEAVCASISSCAAVFAAVFVLEQLEWLNQRYGRNAGDQVLKVFERELVQALRPDDQAFRWTGPAFLVISRMRNQHEVRRSLSRLTAKKLTTTVVVAGREVLIMINYRWTVVAIHECVSGEDASALVDGFTRARAF